MKLSAIYRKAAKLYEKGCAPDTAACRTLAMLSYGDTNGWEHIDNWQAVVLFKDYFKPKDRIYHWWSPDELGNRERILALCFMAAITESEGK